MKVGSEKIICATYKFSCIRVSIMEKNLHGGIENVKFDRTLISGLGLSGDQF